MPSPASPQQLNFRERFAALRDLPPISKDGQRIELMVNAGLAEDAEALKLVGADGIGHRRGGNRGGRRNRSRGTESVGTESVGAGTGGIAGPIVG